MINIEEKNGPLHVTVIVQTDYDIDPATNQPINVVSRVLSKGNVIVKNVVPKSTPKKPKVTLESIAENYPVVTLFKSYYKMNKCAATLIGVLDENGEMAMTLIGNRIRLQMNYKRDKETKITNPVIIRDDEEKLVGAQQVRDALSVSCSGMPNQMLQQYGNYFIAEKQGEGASEIFILTGYQTLLELLEAVGAEIPEELRGEPKNEPTKVAEEKVDDTEELKPTGEIQGTDTPPINLDDAGEDTNGEDSKGDEFTPDFDELPEVSGSYKELEGIDINDI